MLLVKYLIKKGEIQMIEKHKIGEKLGNITGDMGTKTKTLVTKSKNGETEVIKGVDNENIIVIEADLEKEV